jgi:hypothetical protein
MLRPKAGASASALGDRLTQQFPPPAEIHRLLSSELQQFRRSDQVVESPLVYPPIGRCPVRGFPHRVTPNG